MSEARISVSEDTLRRILAEFKLELFQELKKYASQPYVDSIEKRVSQIEQHGSIGSQGNKVFIDDHETRLRVLEKLQWKAVGMAVAVSTVLTLLATVSWHIWG